MTTVNYILQKDSWFSPIEILDRFEKVRAVYGEEVNKPIFKRAREMFAGSVAFLGAYELSPENVYFMQENKQSSAFDVAGVKQTERGKNGILAEILQLEIVEMEDHSKTNDVIEFLESTKFSNKKAYGDNTLIVCVVNKQIPLDQKEVIDKAKKFNAPVYIIGKRIGDSIGTFTIQSIGLNPTKAITFNVDETARKYSVPPRVDFHFEISEKIKYFPKTMKGLTSYEILGLDKEKIYKKYNLKDK